MATYVQDGGNFGTKALQFILPNLMQKIFLKHKHELALNLPRFLNKLPISRIKFQQKLHVVTSNIQ